MDQLISHIAACCSTQQPAQSDGEDALDTLAACMQQLCVGGSRSEAQDRSCRSLHALSPVLTASAALPAVAAADNTTAELPQYRVFTFDIETTGLSTTKDAIIEMALVDVITNSSWSSLVKPEPYRKSSREAYKAHGISHYELSKPHVPTLLQALKALHSFIHRHTAQQPGAVPLLVAHNGYTFDFRALAVAVHRQQQQQGGQLSGPPIGSSSSIGGCGGGGDGLQMMLQLMPEHLLVWDTLALARRLKLHKQCNLTNLQQASIREHFLGSPPSVVHRALADAQELAALLPHLLHWAAAQVDQGLDEKLLPRSFGGFVSAAAAAAAAAGAVDRTAAAGDEKVDNAAAASSCASSNLAASELQTVSSVAAAPVVAAAAAAAAAGTQGARSAAGRASSSSRGRGRRKRLPAAAAAAASGAAGSNSASGVQQQQQQQQLVFGSKNVISRPRISAAVAAVAAITIDSSSEAESEILSEKKSEGASEEKSERENSPAAAVVAAAAAAAVGAVTHGLLCTDNQVCVVSAHSGGSSSSSTAVSAVDCVAGIVQQQHTIAISSSSSSMFHSRVAADQAACSIDAGTYSSSSSGMEQTAAARPPSSYSPAAAAAAAAAADGIGSARPVDSDAIAIQDTHTPSSSSNSGGGGNSSGCSSSTWPEQATAANGLGSSNLGSVSHRNVITPNSVMVKGRSVEIMSSPTFLDLVQATLSSSSSSSVTPDLDRHFRSDLIPRSDLIYLGQYIAGRSDSSSGFSEVLVSHLGLPVVFLLEGLVISKTVKFSHTGGRIKAASLPVKCATRQRAQQQHIKQVAAAINSLTQLQQQQQQDPQQQHHQELYTCMVGNNLQLRLPIKPGAPFLDSTIRQVSSSSTSSSSSSKRLIPLATPNLASVDATDRLQQILPVDAHVSVVLWPSCVWSNNKFRGVTLNCVELWLQEH